MRKNTYKPPTRYDLLRRLGHLPPKGTDKYLKEQPATRDDLLKALKHTAEEIGVHVSDLGEDLAYLPSEWEGEDGAEQIDTSSINTLSIMLRAYEETVSDLDAMMPREAEAA